MYQSDNGLKPLQLSSVFVNRGQRLGASVYFLGLTSLLTDISSEMIASVLPVYLFTVLQISPLHYGLFDGFFNASTAITRLLAAYIADRRQQHKAVAFLGYFLSFISRIGLFFAGFSGLLSVAGVVLLDRLGKGIRTAPRDAMIAASAGDGKTAQAFGVHRAMDAVGAMIGPVLATVLLTTFAQRYDTVFAASAVFAALGLSVLWFGVKQPTRLTAAPQKNIHEPTANPMPVALVATFRQLTQGRFVGLCIIAGVLATFTLSDGMVYISLQQRYGFEMSRLPLLFSATALVFVVLAIPIGRLADRWGSNKVFLMGFVCLGLVYASLVISHYELFAQTKSTPFVWTQHGLQIGFCVLFLGTYYAATDGVLMAHAAQLLPASLHATGMACLATVISLGKFLSSVLFGWLWQSQGQTVAMATFGAGLLCIVLLAVSLTICAPWGKSPK